MPARVTLALTPIGTLVDADRYFFLSFLASAFSSALVSLPPHGIIFLGFFGFFLATAVLPDQTPWLPYRPRQSAQKPLYRS
jgi:hypothetical protein